MALWFSLIDYNKPRAENRAGANSSRGKPHRAGRGRIYRGSLIVRGAGAIEPNFHFVSSGANLLRGKPVSLLL